MPKETLKRVHRELQDGACALTGEILPMETPLFDTHRPIPRAEGGRYDKDNTLVVLPPAHMEEHGTLRRREEQFDELKRLFDDRKQLIKLKVKIENQLLAEKREVDNLLPETKEFLEENMKEFRSKIADRTRPIEARLKEMADDYPVIKAMQGVKGVGPITIAACLVYLDPHKARHASSFWSYAGLHSPSHERYQKGVASGGNKTLRTVLFTMADSQIKIRGPYREVYDKVKARLAVSENLTWSYVTGHKAANGQKSVKQMAWKDTMACHRDGAGRRAIMKHFLADLWYVWRTLEGLPTTPIYAEAQLGMSHKTIDPANRGWIVE